MKSLLRFWKSSRGSASVFLMLIIAPMFIFHAVLIDIVRIKIAERESDVSLKAALRSTLSAYDNVLKDYGLYALGLNEEDAEHLFQEVLSRNTEISATSRVWTLVRPAADEQSIQLKGLYTLANHTVFRQQILEEMKYRAPAEFTVQVMDKLMGGSNTVAALSGAAAFNKQAQEIESLVLKREQALDEAWDLLLKMKEKTAIFRAYHAIRLSELDQLSARIGIWDISAIQESLQALEKQNGRLAEALTVQSFALQELLKKAKENQQLIVEAQSNINALQSSITSLSEQMTDLQTLLRVIPQYTLLLEITKAETVRDAALLVSLQEAVTARLDEAQKLDDSIRSYVSTSAAAGTAPILTADAAAHIVKPGSYYALYKVEASSAAGLMNGFAGAMHATTPFLGDNRWTPERYGILSESNAAYAARASEVIASRQAEEDKRKQASASNDRERQTQLNRINEVVDQLKKLVAECGGLSGGQTIYESLEKGGSNPTSISLAAKYMEYNRVQPGSAPNGGVNSNGALSSGEAAKSRAFQLIDTIVPMITNLAGSFRDELYVNEFALEKFNYRTFGKQPEGGGKVIRSAALSNPQQHALYNQEAEYILYGHASCMLNQSSAYAEMFALRLAIRTTEALFSTEAKLIGAAGSPLLTIVWAAAEGAVKAYQDMTKLVDGLSVPVSEKLAGNAVTMNYKDYLRIFYMLHSNNLTTMSRMQALIEANTGRDLTTKHTYMQGHVVATERLWFFPFLEPLLDYEVKRNRVYIGHTAYMSY